MRYVRVEFAGFAVQLDEELNSFSMYAVGRGTRLEYLQSMSGLDDSFEWFGGTVDARYLVSYEAGDDHFGWTEGYSGRNQFLIALQTYQPTPRQGAGFASQDPRGFEGDGCELTKAGCSGYALGPNSQPVFANSTVIGAGPGVFPGNAGLQSNGATLRRGTGGTFVNGVIARWQNVGLNVRDAATDLMRQQDSLTVARVVLNENGAGNYDPAAACTATGSGGSCGVKASFPGTVDSSVGTSSLFAGLPAAGTVPTLATLDWTPSASSPLASAGVATFSGRIAARVNNYFGGTLQGTSYAGAAAPGGTRWWQGWTDYRRN